MDIDLLKKIMAGLPGSTPVEAVIGKSGYYGPATAYVQTYDDGSVALRVEYAKGE